MVKVYVVRYTGEKFGPGAAGFVCGLWFFGPVLKSVMMCSVGCMCGKPFFSVRRCLLVLVR